MKNLALNIEENKKVELLDLLPLLSTADSKVRLFILNEITNVLNIYHQNPKDGQIFVESADIDELLKVYYLLFSL